MERPSRCSRAPSRSTTGSASSVSRGHPLKGIAPSNIFKSRDGLWMVIAANQDGSLPPVMRGDGTARARRRPERYATHLSRGENQEELEGIIAEWAAQRDAADIDRSSTRPESCAGRSTRLPTSSETPSSRPETCWSPTVDPDFGQYIGPGIVPKLSDTPAKSVVGDLEEGPHNEEILRPARPVHIRARSCARMGGMTLTVCDVGPRDGLQNETTQLSAAVRAAGRPARARRAAPRRGRLFVI